MKEVQDVEVSLEGPKEETQTDVTLDVSEEAEIPIDVSVQQEEETAADFQVPCFAYTVKILKIGTP